MLASLKRFLLRLADEFHKLNLTPEAKREALIFFRQLGLKIVGIIGAIVVAMIGGNMVIKIYAQKNVGLNFGQMVSNSGQMANFRDLHLTQNIYPDTATRQVVEELDKRLSDGEQNIEFTKKDIELLKKALADLDNRTSGLERLPDGRTKIGSFVTGAPSIVIDEHQAAIENFDKGKYQESLDHSKKAIQAYASSENMPSGGVSIGGTLEPKNVAKLYRLATMSAQNLKFHEEALKYALLAVENDPTSFHKGLLATAYANLRKHKESLALLDEVIAQDPSNETWRNLKDEVQKHV